MSHSRQPLSSKPEHTIGLVAHDHRKPDLLEWVRFNLGRLRNCRLVCTGTTGGLISSLFANDAATSSTEVVVLKSGPLGGDQQLGAWIAEEKVDFLIFFWDPMAQQPHDVDVKALLRIAVLYNVPTACNRSTADFVISSPLFDSDYRPVRKDYSEYLKRNLPPLDG